MTGRPPFTGDQSEVMYKTLEQSVTPPTELDPTLPTGIDDVLMTALAKEKADRYDTVVYLRDALEEEFGAL
jgi:serine/threonine protein kinase